MATAILVLSTVKSVPEFPALQKIEKDISHKPLVELFAWTLTHHTNAFSKIDPLFRNRKELLDHVTGLSKENQTGISTISLDPSAEITRIALDKINNEWRIWVSVHSDFSFDERKLDNMLMIVLYRFILERDEKKCVLCQLKADLTIHHIIQKRRNMRKVSPPFGRSVPTNLITLCRNCHSFFDPMILVKS